MVNRHTASKIRKVHRYLGIILGIQFLMWTVSGLYFSWTDIDKIHGDQFRNETMVKASFSDLISPTELKLNDEITTLELLDIANKPYYWINESKLFNAKTGKVKNGITKTEALEVAEKNMLSKLKVKNIEQISEVGNHHEYRSGPLPVYVISYENSNEIKAYVLASNGSFKMLAHRNWRIFDFLWMTHTMDYGGRDNINNIVLRVFSFFGLITVLSGFLLWYISSPFVRKLLKRINKKKK